MIKKTLIAALSIILVFSLIYFARDAQANPKADTPGRNEAGKVSAPAVDRIEHNDIPEESSSKSASQNCCLDWGFPGDANGDMTINIVDIMHVLMYLYQEPYGEPAGAFGCDALLDANGSGDSPSSPEIDILDISFLVRYVYCEPSGEPALCCPPDCVQPKSGGGEVVK